MAISFPGGAGSATYQPVTSSFANPTSLSGKPFSRRSHSFGLSPGLMCTAGKEWMAQLMTRLGSSGSLLGYAIGGSTAVEGALVASGSGANKFTAAEQGGLLVLEYEGGSSRYLPPATGVATETNAYNTLLSLANADLTNSFQVTASWSVGDTTASGTSFYGNGTIHYTSSDNSTLTFTIDGTKCAGGVCYLLMALENNCTRTLTTTVDAVANASFSKAGQFTLFNSAEVGNPQITFGKGILKLTGIPTSGTHTVVVNSGVGGGQSANIEAVLYPKAVPNTKVLVVKDPLIRTTDEALYVASKPAYDAVIDTVTNGLSWAFPVDTGLGGWWDADLMLGSDQNHPNDLGMTAITNRMVQVLKAHIS